MFDTALLVIDMQNAFCSPLGSFRKRGYNLLDLEQIIENIKVLLHNSNKMGWEIIFTKLEFKEDYSNAGLLVMKKHPSIKKEKAYVEESWDSDIIDELKELMNDNTMIIRKTRYDPFLKTELEAILRNKSIKNLLLVGVLTNVCLESAARSAFDHDFNVTVIKEATSTYSENLYKTSLVNINSHFGQVISINEVFKTLSSTEILPVY